LISQKHPNTYLVKYIWTCKLMSTTFQRVTKQPKRNVGIGSKTKPIEIRENKIQ